MGRAPWILLVLLIALAAPAGAQPLELTPAEQRWLASDPLVRLGPAPNFPPVEFFDAQGAYRGLAADVMRIVEERTGLRFEVVRCGSWQEVLERTEGRQIDAWAEAAVTPARAERMDFTRAYIELPTVILGRVNRVSGVSLSALRDERVVVVRGYATHDYLKQELPGLEPILVPDLETGLRLLSFGGADSMVASLAPASYYIQRLGITNLRVIGEAGFSWKLAFASRRELPHLAGIVQKALDGIPPARMQELRQRWLTLETPPWRPSPLQILAALASLTLALALTALWVNRQLRRRVEASTAELQRSKRALQTLLDAVPMALFAVDAEGRVVETNARSRQLFAPHEDPHDRLTSSSLNGRLLVDMLFPGRPTVLDGLLREALAGKPQRCEREARLPDGAPLDLELSLEAVTLSETRVVLVSARDLSNQRRLGRMQSAFLSTVTHELRTPLTSIYGSLRLLEALPLDAEESRDLIQVATRNGERLLQLVDDVIDVERLNRGQLPFELAREPLPELLERAVADNAPYGERLGVRLALGEVPEVEVLVDAERVAQILANLLSNAAKFSPKGGEVEVWGELEEDFARVLVRDHGPGIPADFQPRVFERFAQAGSSSERSGGTGLGLAICREIVQRLGGKIGFETEEGQGTTFTVELPLARQLTFS